MPRQSTEGYTVAVEHHKESAMSCCQGSSDMGTLTRVASGPAANHSTTKMQIRSRVDLTPSDKGNTLGKIFAGELSYCHPWFGPAYAATLCCRVLRRPEADLDMPDEREKVSRRIGDAKVPQRDIGKRLPEANNDRVVEVEGGRIYIIELPIVILQCDTADIDKDQELQHETDEHKGHDSYLPFDQLVDGLPTGFTENNCKTIGRWPRAQLEIVLKIGVRTSTISNYLSSTS